MTCRPVTLSPVSIGGKDGRPGPDNTGMKVFLNRTSPVSLQEQLAAQIGQMVAAGDVARGSVLPSIRALAGRLQVHHNTVRAAYQRLEALGVIVSRKGSGTRVVDHDDPRAIPGEPDSVQVLAERFVARARELGHADTTLREALERALADRPLERIVVINPHPDLLRIYVHELAGTVDFPTSGMTFEELVAAPGSWRERTLFLTSTNHASSVRQELGDERKLILMTLASIQPLLDRARTLPADGLLAIASSSERFRVLFREMLSAVCDDDRLLDVPVHDPDLARSRLRLATHVVTDAESATRLVVPERTVVDVFHLLGEDCRAELAGYLASVT